MQKDQTYKLNLSDWVIRDIKDRMFEAIFECEPTATIEIEDYVNGKRVNGVIANLRGWQSLLIECKITADNLRGEFQYDRSNTEAKSEFNKFTTAANRINNLINKITNQ